jgi:hypothetical protein
LPHNGLRHASLFHCVARKLKTSVSCLRSRLGLVHFEPQAACDTGWVAPWLARDHHEGLSVRSSRKRGVGANARVPLLTNEGLGAGVLLSRKGGAGDDRGPVVATALQQAPKAVPKGPRLETAPGAPELSPNEGLWL